MNSLFGLLIDELYMGDKKQLNLQQQWCWWLNLNQKMDHSFVVYRGLDDDVEFHHHQMIRTMNDDVIVNLFDEFYEFDADESGFQMQNLYKDKKKNEIKWMNWVNEMKEVFSTTTFFEYFKFSKCYFNFCVISMGKISLQLSCFNKKKGASRASSGSSFVLRYGNSVLKLSLI